MRAGAFAVAVDVFVAAVAAADVTVVVAADIAVDLLPAKIKFSPSFLETGRKSLRLGVIPTQNMPSKHCQVRQVYQKGVT